MQPIKINDNEFLLLKDFFPNKEYSITRNIEGYHVYFKEISSQELFEFGKICGNALPINHETKQKRKLIYIPLRIYLIAGCLFLLLCLISISNTTIKRFNEIQQNYDSKKNITAIDSSRCNP